MNKQLLLTIIIIFITSNVASADNPYGTIYSYDYYYNGNIQELDTPKPLLKIGEPFEIRIDLTVYNEYRVAGKLMELGEGNFEIIDGPSPMDTYSTVILMPNETETFKWKVAATEKWAGGSLPLNFHYSIVEKGNPEPVVNGEFTAVYPTISTEYYEQPDSTPTQTTNSTPAFTIPLTLTALLLAYKRKR